MKTRRTSSSAITTKNLLLISTCGAASPTPFASIIVSNISFISTRNSSLISSGSTGTATCLKTSSPSFVILNIYFLKLITIYSLPPLVVIPAFLVLPAIGGFIIFPDVFLQPLRVLQDLQHLQVRLPQLQSSSFLLSPLLHGGLLQS